MKPSLFALLLLAGCAAHSPAPTRATASSLAFEEKWIDSAPVQSFRSGNKEQDLATLKNVWKEIGNGDPLDFSAYIELFPDKFRLVDPKNTQGLIDDLILKILSTDSGKASFCFLSSSKAGFVPYYLGVSKAAAKKIKQVCANQKVTKTQKQFFVMMNSVAFPLDIPGQRQKRLFFVVSESGAPKIEAYSTKENTSVFFLNRNEITEANLIRILSHELAVSYDQFVSVAKMNDPVTWETGLSVLFDKPPFTGSGPYTHFKKPGNENALRCALNDPAIRYALTTERAFRFEDKIITELGLPSPALATKTGCADAVRRWLPVFPEIFPLVRSEVDKSLGFLESQCGEEEPGRPLSKRPIPEWAKVFDKMRERLLNPADPQRIAFVNSRIRTLEETFLEPKNGGQPQQLCEFMLEPRVGPRQPAYYGGGPRPRAGGWSAGEE